MRGGFGVASSLKTSCIGLWRVPKFANQINLEALLRHFFFLSESFGG